MSLKDEKAPVGGVAGGRCCAICCVMGLVPHKVVLDHIAIGVTRAHNALWEQRLVRRVGVHLCLEGKAGTPAIVSIVLGVLVAQPVAGVELHARGGGVVVQARGRSTSPRRAERGADYGRTDSRQCTDSDRSHGPA